MTFNGPARAQVHQGPTPTRQFPQAGPWMQPPPGAFPPGPPGPPPPGPPGGPPPGGYGKPPRKRRRGPMLGLAAAVLIALVGGFLVATHEGAVTGPPSGTGGTGGQPEALANCTTTASDGAAARSALESAGPGARICLSGDLGSEELEVRRSGSANSPIMIIGGGSASTGRITVKADHVVVDGVRMSKPRSPGFLLMGNDITVRNSTVDSPQVLKKGDDGDGIRFFGNDIKILNNVVKNAKNLNGQKGNHADAVQTFATSDEYKPSQRILIDGNRFENIDNMCLIAEGPNSEEGDGSEEGKSSGFTVTNNYCAAGAGQAFFFDDVSNATLTGNTIAGNVKKAFSLQNKSVKATIKDNKVTSEVDYEVGMDGSSEKGYNGPEPGGDP